MNKTKNLNLHVCGLDEAGRGAWAGPLVATAVTLPCSINKIAKLAKTRIRDGKLLTAEKRRQIYQILQNIKTEIHIEIISARSINNHGIGWANREIFRRLIRKIEADEYIVDGNLKLGRINGKTHRIRSIVNADATIPSVILAGIVAKVERDKLMQDLDRQFPVYYWHKNAGYGTKTHLESIIKYQTTRHHRSIYITTALRNKQHSTYLLRACLLRQLAEH